MKPKVSELLQIKEKYDVNFSVVVVPMIFHDSYCYNPGFNICREVIEFCHLVGADIDFDVYVEAGGHEYDVDGNVI
jgi:hypothetical protein